MRLAILTTHPIQYYAPWFRYLAQRFDLEVLYAHRQEAGGQSDAGFGVAFEWDVPLLDGYKYRWLTNISRQPGLQTFGGCDTPELFNLIHPRNYDALLVLGWNKKSFVQGIRAAWRNKVPVLSRGDSNLGTQRSWFKRVLKYPVYRWALPRFSAHLYVGTRNHQYLRHYGVREEYFFSPHFVDNDFFARRATEARISGEVKIRREQFQIPSDAFVALFVGKFISKKRPMDFLHASLRVADQNKKFHALFVGDGPLRGDMELAAANHSGQIHFAGFQNQSVLPEFYAAADVLVLPSNGEETWGLVVNEAMACGVPALVSNAVGCAPDLIEEGATGWTFPLGDIDALAKRIVQFPAVDSAALKRKSEAHSMVRATDGLERAARFVCGIKS